MSPQSLARVLLMISACLATGAAWFQHLQSIHLERRALALADEVRRSANQELALRRHIQSTRVQLDRLKAEAQHRAAQSASQRPALSDFTAAWLGDPAAQTKSLRTQQVYAAVTYHAFFRRLGLSPSQIQSFLDNVQERDGAKMDLRSARLELGLTEDDPSVTTMAGQINQSYAAAQSALLGSDGFNQLTAYDQENWPRMLANDVVGGALTAGLSFSPAQTQALAAAMAQAAGPDGVYGATNWPQVDQAAATFLSPEQLSYLKSADFLGALGIGGRYQETLNRLISKGDAADQAAAPK